MGKRLCDTTWTDGFHFIYHSHLQPRAILRSLGIMQIENRKKNMFAKQNTYAYICTYSLCVHHQATRTTHPPFPTESNCKTQAMKSPKSPILVKLAKYFNIGHVTWKRLLFWVFCLFFLAGLTLNDFLPLLHQYLNNNVATQITVLNAAPDRPPHMTVCLPYPSKSLSKIGHWASQNGSTKCLECNALRNHSWDLRNMIDFTGETLSDDGVASGILRRLLDEEDLVSLMTLNDTNFNWNQPIVDAVARLIKCLAKQDTIYLYDYKEMTTCHKLDWLKTKISNEILDIMYNMTLQATQLYLKINGNDSILDRFGYWVGETHICFTLKPSTHSEIFKFKSRPGNSSILPPWKRWKRKDIFMIMMDDAFLYDSIQIVDLLYHTKDELLTQEINYEMVSLFYSIQTKVKEGREDRKCFNNSISSARCLAERQVGTAVQFCKCIPFAYRYFTNIHPYLPYCNISRYKKCKKYLRMHYKQNKQECEEKCDHIFYQWKSYGSTKTDWKPLDDLTFGIDLIPETTPFIEFKVTKKFTWEEFISQFGGLINLYLGTSGMSICAFIFLCIDLFRQWYKSRDGQSTDKVEKSSKDVQADVDHKIAEPLKSAQNNELISQVTELINRAMEGRISRIETSMEVIQEEMQRIAGMLEK